MNAITLWEPWATLIAMGLKTIETRTHGRFVSLVGKRIAIHAARRRWDADAPIDEWLRRGWLSPDEHEAVCHLSRRGCVVCTAKVTKHRMLRPDDAQAAMLTLPPGELLDRHGYFLEDVERLERPIPAKGKQGIWKWEMPR